MSTGSQVEILYRYSDSPSHVGVWLQTFQVVKETPCGYWFAYSEATPRELWRWTSKTARRRFCYPTKEEAWNSYRIRKRKRVDHLQRDLNKTKQILSFVERQDKPLERDHIIQYIYASLNEWD